jgi:hypothetical protein
MYLGIISALSADMESYHRKFKDILRILAFGIFGFEIPPCHLQVVMALKVQPELRAVAEVKAQPECRISRDATPIVNYLGDAVRGNSYSLRKLALRQTIGSQEFFFQHLAGRDRRKIILRHRLISSQW